MLRILLILLIPLKLSFFMFIVIIGVMGYTFEVLTPSKVSKIASTMLLLPFVVVYKLLFSNNKHKK